MSNFDRYKNLVDHTINNVFSKSGRSVNGWISIKERLPDSENMVLTWNGDFIGISYFNGKRWFDDGEGKLVENVIYWQPLPEPPEE